MTDPDEFLDNLEIVLREILGSEYPIVRNQGMGVIGDVEKDPVVFCPISGPLISIEAMIEAGEETK